MKNFNILIVEGNLKEENQNLNPAFDDDSLTVYGALLSEQLDASPEGSEVAKPAALVGKIISDREKAEQAKKREERRKKAEQLLEDLPMSDDQQKDALIMEWTDYAETQNDKNFNFTDDLTEETQKQILPKTREVLA